jgi:hypothetical protein
VLECSFPGCSFKTLQRGLIDYHHIIPKSEGGSNKGANRTYLCPSCHRDIFVPSMKAGHHSIVRERSIVIQRVLQTSRGKALQYYQCSNGIEKIIYLGTKEVEVLDDSLQVDLFEDQTRIHKRKETFYRKKLNVARV